MIEIATLPLGLYETNCYIVCCGENAVVIDPADDVNRIVGALGEKGLTIDKILLTHGHLDHALACAPLMEKSGAELYMHEADFPMVSDENFAHPFAGRFKKRFKPISDYNAVHEGDKLMLGTDTVIDVIETPGHTGGSVMYRIESEKVIFTGDTVFYLSVGNCSTEADFEALLKSTEKIRNLKEEYILLPGHGQHTSLTFEIRNNPYFNN